MCGTEQIVPDFVVIFIINNLVSIKNKMFILINNMNGKLLYTPSIFDVRYYQIKNWKIDSQSITMLPNFNEKASIRLMTFQKGLVDLDKALAYSIVDKMASQANTLFGYTVSLIGLAGCNSSPSQNILGSFFPSWIICALAGIGITVVVRQLFVACDFDSAIPAPLVVYILLAIAFAFATWIIWLG